LRVCKSLLVGDDLIKLQASADHPADGSGRGRQMLGSIHRNPGVAALERDRYEFRCDEALVGSKISPAIATDGAIDPEHLAGEANRPAGVAAPYEWGENARLCRVPRQRAGAVYFLR